LIGAPSTSGTYTSANGSIAGNKPHNPFTTSGAVLAMNSVGGKKDSVTRICDVIEKMSAIAGSRINCSMPSYLSMSEGDDRDLALIYWLRASGTLSKDTDINKVCEFYFQLCSMEANCSAAATMAATLANPQGSNPLSNSKCVDPKRAKHIVSLMSGFGMNDFSDKWNETIGLPAKCSSSGAILIVVPKLLGLCIYSAPIDGKGISSRGAEFSKLIAQKFPFLRAQKF